MSKLSKTTLIDAPAGRVFAYVDDNLARHMSESGSMPMMGSKFKLEIVTADALPPTRARSFTRIDPTNFLNIS